MANLPTVVGITFSETEIFVVCYRMLNVLVFDSETFVLLRSIPGVASKPWDITYSGELLFISEEESNRLHRIPVCTSELVSCWPVFGRKSTLSTAKSGNIVVTSDRQRFFVIMEFTTNGQVVKKFYLDDPIEELDYIWDRPAHAVHLDNGQFLFCSDMHRGRVCLLDGQGNVVKLLAPLGWHASEADVNGSGGSAQPDESETNGPESGSDGPRVGRLYTDSIATDGSEPDGSEPDGSEPDGPEPDGSEPDGSEPDGSEPGGIKLSVEKPVPDPIRSEQHGPETNGPVKHGLEPNGLEKHGPEPIRSEQYGPETNGPEKHGQEPYRSEQHGPEIVDWLKPTVLKHYCSDGSDTDRTNPTKWFETHSQPDLYDDDLYETDPFQTYTAGRAPCWNESSGADSDETDHRSTDSDDTGPSRTSSGSSDRPCYLAADENGFSLILDSASKTIALLNDRLKFVKELVPGTIGLKNPSRMCLDRARHRLFVVDHDDAGYSSKVLVFNFISQPLHL